MSVFFTELISFSKMLFNSSLTLLSDFVSVLLEMDVYLISEWFSCAGSGFFTLGFDEKILLKNLPFF